MLGNKDFQTPPDVCEYMVGLIPASCFRILEPTPGEGNLVRAIVDVHRTAIAPDDYWNWKINTISNQPIHAVVANPPFSPASLGYKFLFSFMEISPIVICLMPWIALINSDSRTKKLLEFGLVSVTHLPRKTFPGARSNFCILFLRNVLDIQPETRIIFY